MARLPVELLLARGRALDTGFSPDRSLVASLSNGSYSVRLNARGSGFSDWRGIAVTRWSADRVCDTDGFHLYLRDLDDQQVWSAGYLPTRVNSDDYQFRFSERAAEISRIDRDLECRFTVCVAAEHDCDLRRCRLTNHGGETRRVELTSYLEWVLTGRDADASHPAFSKLFLETHYCAERRAIFARRRPRSSDEPAVWGFHALVGNDAHAPHEHVQYETNRAAFIGRGRSLAHPRALDAEVRLTGQTGAVLDPIASLRTVLVLRPGECREIVLLLGAASSRDEAMEILTSRDGLPEVNRELDGALASRHLKNGQPTREKLDIDAGRDGDRHIIHAPHSRPRMQTAPAQTAAECTPAAARASGRDARAFDVAEPLEFDNGYGGFSADGREYVIRLRPNAAGEHRRPPLPWVNVIANDVAGFIVSESGAGYTWAGNSRLNRLTAWHNDPVCDPHSEALWICDEAARQFWSATPGPTPAPVEYVVRHGFGYTKFVHENDDLLIETMMFIAPERPLKITRVRLANRGSRPRRLSFVSFAHWALGDSASAATTISTTYDAELKAILATNPHRETYSKHLAFSAACAFPESRPIDTSFTCDRAAFLGERGDITTPAALVSLQALDGLAGAALDACAAWRVPLELVPGEERELVFLLGEASDRDGVAALLNKYRRPGEIERARQAVTDFWRDTVSAIEIETPDREIDLMAGGWLTYQNLSCRMWARSAYYQPGGAFGFRDQLQDAAALIFVRPDITRAQIIRHAGQQFVEGDVLHWWHPDTGYGLRTRFSDDLLWLPSVTTSYVATTGDESIWDEQASFVAGPQLAGGHAELYMCPVDAGVRASVYEHCCRAVDRGLTFGSRGLPLIGCGDWNDGFSRVGRLGRGESVWLGFFICHVLDHLLPVCRKRGDDRRVSRFEACRDRVAVALNSEGWDGAWYRRAYYDNGEPIGSATSDECQIDALAQAWAVLSGVASPDRAQAAIDAALERLVCREAGLIKLLTPPFDQTLNDPGYIKGYLPGIRENGGQYTHGVLWLVRALAEMGRGTTAVELLKMLSPVSHTATAERAEIYQTEPYVVAADVYGEPPHVGRGGWTWYTGSAGWMFRVAVESIFGLSIDRGHTLVVKPVISASWPRCRLTYRLPGEMTRYQITIENPHGKETGVVSAVVDGGEIVVDDGAARIPLAHDGDTHRVEIHL
jgi:cyclic beta-1,2-glucan synthetase